MALSTGGILINALTIIVIIVLIIMGVSINHSLNICTNFQSFFCMDINCPCDPVQPPCNGHAMMPGSRDGTWYCANTPYTLVNTDGSQAN
jgi:hypothetical protein